LELENALFNSLPNSKVTPSSTALMIIDMQYVDAHRDLGAGARAKDAGLMDDLEYYFSRLETLTVPNIKRLIDACRDANLPVIHVRCMNLAGDSADTSWRYKHKGIIVPPGSKTAEFLEELAPAPGEVVISKTTSSVFVSTNVDFVLRNMGIDTVIMTGVATNNCVESGTRNAGDLGYKVLLVEDACAAMTEEGHGYAIRHLHGNFAIVKSTDEILDEIKVASSSAHVATPDTQEVGVASPLSIQTSPVSTS
jgi:nicotinamidase-related amidase